MEKIAHWTLAVFYLAATGTKKELREGYDHSTLRAFALEHEATQDMCATPMATAIMFFNLIVRA